MRTPALRRGVLWAGVVLILLLPWVITSRYMMGVVNIGLITVVVVLGMNVAKGYCGLISVGHAGFWGIGAYTASILAVKMGWPFALTLLAAILVTTAAGALVGIPVLRLKGLYLAMATLGFGLMVQLTALNWRELTGGADGIKDIPLPSLGPLVAATPLHLYYLLLAFVVLSAWFCLRIEATKYGRAMRAINSHELAAELMGVDTVTEKIRCFAISAGLAGLGGALYAHDFGYVNPEQFGFYPSVMFIVMLVIGGLGTVPGAIAGTLLLTFLPEWLRPLRYWWMTIYGVLVMLFILVAPWGLYGLARRWLPWLFPPSEPPDPETMVEGSGAKVQLPLLHDAPLDHRGLALAVGEVSISFGGLEALRDVDLELAPKEIHALIGPNGAGKTSLVNCITGVYIPDHGTVQLHGQALAGLRPHRRARLGITRTFQNLALWKDLSVLDNLLIARVGWQHQGFWPVIFNTGAARAEEKAARDRAEILLRAVGLWGEHRKVVGSLPYGHQKLVEIVRALMTEPRVLLLDEPAAGLSRPEVERLTQLMRAIRDQGVAVLLIEHNIDLVMDIADRITVLNFGRRIATGVPAAVRQNPDVIEAYLGAADLTVGEEVAASA